MTILTSTAAQWPLLQSKTEQKFKSGLFNVSAQYIRPVGNTDLPETIETSIGRVDVWPDPTVSSGTDGFERINATGYGVWDENAEEIVYGYEPFSIVGTARQVERCLSPDYWELQTFGSGESQYQAYVLVPGCSELSCGAIDESRSSILRSTVKQVLLETVSIKKIGADIPSSPGLKFYDTTMAQLTAITPSWLGFGQFAQVNGYIGSFTASPFSPIIASLRQNKYGNVVETEVVYALRGPNEISFGTWYAPAPDPAVCDPGPKPADPPL